MQSILEELYCGNIGFDSGRYEQNSPFVKAAQRKHDSIEKQKASLNDNEKELLEQYCEAESEITSITRYDTYTHALKFGALFTVEILMEAFGEGGVWR